MLSGCRLFKWLSDVSQMTAVRGDMQPSVGIVLDLLFLTVPEFHPLLYPRDEKYM
jgi:hypothetical protein